MPARLIASPLRAGARRRRCGLLLSAVVLLTGGCGAVGTSSGTSAGRLSVVAAENFWGSLAAQLGGDRVHVSSIIVNPDTDPHSYEPTTADAIALARSQMAIVNGIGYDTWASRLLTADASGSRAVLTVGDVLGLKTGDNPHQWYSPPAVARVIAAITADYRRLDPAHGAYYDRRRVIVQSEDLARYDQLRRAIRRRYGGVPVGYSESVFQPLGDDLGLRLLTPYRFARAVAEGTDVSAADKQVVDAQVRRRQIVVWVFNSQNITPDVQRVNDLARAAHVPIATVTETLAPASASFEQWQDGELTRLMAALKAGTGR